MAHISVEGMEELIELLIITEKQTDRLCGRSIYPGAKIVANVCKNELQKIHTDDSWFGFGNKRLGPTKRQLAGLIESMGIAEMRHSRGVYDVKLGFDGYNDVPSSNHKKGFQPNALIARSVNKGTSFMVAQPFMDKTINISKANAEEAIKKQFDIELDKIWSKQNGKF